MSEPGKPMDEALAALYRGLPRDDPPPAVDAAILAAARASVIAKPRRQWAVPVSLAAVLVLSVGVTLRVFEERPDTQSMQAPAAPPVAAPPSAASPSEPAPSAPSPPSATAQYTQAPAAAVPPANAGPPAAVAGRSMAGADRAERAPLAAKSEAESNLASAEAERPEAWLDRIVTLRAQARHAEADENFAQFKRRFPGYIIPPEVLEKIAPRP